MDEMLQIEFNVTGVKVRRFLKSLNTRQLMEVHRQCRAYGGHYIKGSMSISQAEIKKELDKREHIPNKAEAKAGRKLKIANRNPKSRGDK